MCKKWKSALEIKIFFTPTNQNEMADHNEKICSRFRDSEIDFTLVDLHRDYPPAWELNLSEVGTFN